MIAFSYLLLAHFLADFPLQTNAIYQWKVRSFWGVLIHSFLHLLCMVALFLRNLPQVWIPLGILFLLHTLQDHLKVRIGAEKVNTPRPFILDQVLHYLWLGLAAGGTSLRGVQGGWMPAGIALLLSGVIAATFMGTILIYSLAQSRPDEPHNIPVNTWIKARDFIERGLLFGILYLGPLWWGLGLVVWGIKGFVWKRKIGGPYYSGLLELGVSPLWTVFCFIGTSLLLSLLG